MRGSECLLCYGAVDGEGNWVITLTAICSACGCGYVWVFCCVGSHSWRDEILAGVVPGVDEMWLAWIIAGVTGD